jgi:hypothetical protein
MKRLLSVAMMLVLILGLAAVFPSRTSAQDNEYTTTVSATYLYDNTGYAYGAHYYVSTTDPAGACVAPYVVSSSNVNGSVVPLIQLSPSESNASIGEFISADRNQAWSVDVHAKWKSGGC